MSPRKNNEQIDITYEYKKKKKEFVWSLLRALVFFHTTDIKLYDWKKRLFSWNVFKQVWKVSSVKRSIYWTAIIFCIKCSLELFENLRAVLSKLRVVLVPSDWLFWKVRSVDDEKRKINSLQNLKVGWLRLFADIRWPVVKILLANAIWKKREATITNIRKYRTGKFLNELSFSWISCRVFYDE